MQLCLHNAKWVHVGGHSHAASSPLQQFCAAHFLASSECFAALAKQNKNMHFYVLLLVMLEQSRQSSEPMQLQTSGFETVCAIDLLW